GRVREAPRHRGLAPPDHPARGDVPDREVLRVPREDRPLPGGRLPRGVPPARPALRRRGPAPRGRGRPRGSALLLALLRDDRSPRGAHDHRPAHPGPARGDGGARPLQRGLAHPGGADRALLALRGHRLDLPLPAPLPDRAPLMAGHHVVSWRLYVFIFVALAVLTAVTVFAAGVDFGPFNTVIALGIASLKATLVILFFMHMRWSPRLTTLFLFGGFVFLAILILLTISDYISRPWPITPA